MHPNTFGPPSTTRHLGSLFAAAAACAVIVGSQLGVAELYVAQADTALAQGRAQAVAQQASAPAGKQARNS